MNTPTTKTTLVRVRKTTDFGEHKEVENSLVAPMLGNHNKRGKKLKKTLEAIDKANDRHAAKRVENKIKANFKPMDWFLTLDYNDEHLPADEAGAVRLLRNFIDRLKRLCKKLGIDLKYLKTTEQGEKSKRWHHHLIIPGQITYEQIEKLWQPFGTIWLRRLWIKCKMGSSDGILEVKALAEYFVGANKHGKRREDRPIGKKRYSFSRNCIEPVITYEPMSLRWRKTPREPEGWQILPGSIEEYRDAYGLMHQKYVLVRRE